MNTKLKILGPVLVLLLMLVPPVWAHEEYEGRVDKVKIAVWVGPDRDEIARLDPGDTLSLKPGQRVKLRLFTPRDGNPTGRRQYLCGQIIAKAGGSKNIKLTEHDLHRGSVVIEALKRGAGGKANLHKGAVGAGIDLSSGETLAGVLGDEVVHDHPDTGALISGLYIPHWDSILQSAARGMEVTGLGYLGVDIVIDRDLGPLILEMNARPGLNIQIANCTGLSTRIDRIDEIFDPKANPVTRARICRQEFPAQRQTSLPLDADA